MNTPTQQLDPEILCQLPNVELVKIIIEQALVIEKLQADIKELQEEIQRLRVSRDLDSKTSSSPPSTDLLKKSENKKSQSDEPDTNSPKRKPGGQPGHGGKTRKGFERVDRNVMLRPQMC